MNFIIPESVTAGWLYLQSCEAERNGEELVKRGYHAAADAWFQLADSYRLEVEIHFPANPKRQQPAPEKAP